MEPAKVKKKLRVLMLEDAPTDAELAERELRKAGFLFTAIRVETRDAFVLALEEFRPDIILSDYKLPDFDGLSALQMVRRSHPEVPVIIVTGALADIEAVELIKAGARDYVLKDRLARLAPAVQQALSMEQGIRARKMAEEKFRKIGESAQDAIIMMAERRITFWNAAAERIFGYSTDEAMGKELQSLLMPQHARAAFDAGYARFELCGEGPAVGNVHELIALRKDGTEFPLEISVSATRMNDQWHAIGIARDISERKRAEQMLAESHYLLKNVVENAPIRVFWKDSELRYLGCNTAFARDAGLSRPEDLIGKDDFQLCWREQAERYRSDDRRVMESGIPKLGYEEPQTTPAGQTLWARSSKVPLRAPDGKVFGILGIYEDITEHKRAEEQLRRSEKTLSEAQRIAHLGNWELDLVSHVLTWSDEIYRIFEIAPERFDASFDAFLDLVHPEDREWVSQAYADSVRDKVPYDIVHRLRMPDGRIKYVNEQCETYYGEDGKPLRSVGTVHDITRSKQDEARLRRLNRELRAISECNQVLVRADDERSLIDAICRIVCDDAGYRMVWVGYAENDVTRPLHPVAWAGADAGYLAHSGFTLADMGWGHDPGEAAIRTGEIDVIDDFASDPRAASWREAALQRGYRSSIALPLKDEGARPFGVLCIYSADPHAFTKDEQRLLGELADDLAFGIVSLRTRAERNQAHELIEKRVFALTQPLEGGSITFEDLFNPAEIQRIQDEFALATGVASIITRPDGTPLTAPSNFTHLCGEIIRKSEKGCSKCFLSDSSLGRFHPDGPIVQPCLSGGLWEAGASIAVGGHHIANWLIGQVRDETQRESDMRAYAREIGVDEETFMDAFRKVPIMPLERFKQIARALFTLANQLSTSAYQNVQQARFITERNEAAKAIEHLAFYDLVTQLPNRRLLQDRLQQAMAVCARVKRTGALLFIDLDNFKLLNDTCGHDVGDRLLVEVARRLHTCVREGDTISRLGGDEFVVMLKDLSGSPAEAAMQAKAIGEKMLAVLSQPYLMDDRVHHSTSSIGATLFADCENSVEELLKQADIAMYQAKAAGRNALRFFDPAMQATLAARAEMEVALRLGIHTHQFVLHYQAQLDGARNIIGAEALLRWQHPKFGMVLPSAFIPLAEEAGLILPIGQWVLEEACALLSAWSLDPRRRDMYLAINVSARQFRQEDFVERVQQALADSGAPVTRLKLELTESLVLDDVEDSIAKMRALKDIGVGFSMDDFGTGYSSLSYLTRLPLDQIKIDKSFIHNLPDNLNDAVVVQSIITLARSLGISVVAEGVESEAQRVFLEQHGCPTYQGYLFSEPVPLADFEKLLARQ